MSELDGIMVAAIRYRSGEGHGQSVEDRAWLLRYLDRQPAALLRDTPEAEDQLTVLFAQERMHMGTSRDRARALLDALREAVDGG